MSEKKEKAHTMVYETQESLYEKALSKMNKDQLIVQYAYKVENYRKAAEMFREVGDYADAAELAMRCDELAQKAKEDEKQHRYDTAVYHKENAKSLKGYEKAAKLFEEIGDYKDSKNQADECGQRAEQIRKRNLYELGSNIIFDNLDICADSHEESGDGSMVLHYRKCWSAYIFHDPY